LNSKTHTDANDQGVVVNIKQTRERYECDGGVLQMLQKQAGSVASHRYFSFCYHVFAAILVFHYHVFAVHIFPPLNYLILELTGHIGVISSNVPDGTRRRDTKAGADICSHAIVVCG
jgi:hypothetical protein